MDINIQLDSNQNLYYDLWLKPKKRKRTFAKPGIRPQSRDQFQEEKKEKNPTRTELVATQGPDLESTKNPSKS